MRTWVPAAHGWVLQPAAAQPSCICGSAYCCKSASHALSLLGAAGVYERLMLASSSEKELEIVRDLLPTP